MRIAYISLHWPRTITSGVGQKILRQITAWRNAGHDVEFFMHSRKSDTENDLLPGRVFFFVDEGGLRTEWARIWAAQELIEAVRVYQPDIIYLRYSMYVYPIQRVAEIAPLVEEITTNDLSQHSGLGRVLGLYNRLSRGLIIRRASGLIYLSQELASAPFNASYGKPFMVIGDGADLQSITPLPAPQNQNPQLVFIGSPGSLWQGVDKLPRLAEKFPKMGIHVIGYDHIEGMKGKPVNLHLHGYLTTAEYKKILADMDCAIGSLALHRISLDESSPLKTRECLAYGLPMILPYKDTDLMSLKADFLMEIPNREDNIETHGQAIYDFAYRMMGRRADRAALFPLLDYAHKEQRRLEFFKKIIHEKNAL